MTSAARIRERVRGILEDQLHVAVASADTDLIETGAIDSLTLVDLLLQLEQVFGITIPLEELELDQLRSLVRIAQTVEARVRSRPGPATALEHAP